MNMILFNKYKTLRNKEENTELMSNKFIIIFNLDLYLKLT